MNTVFISIPAMTMPTSSIDEAATMSLKPLAAASITDGTVVLVTRRMIPIYRAIRFGFARSFFMLTVLSPLMIE